MMVLLNKEKNMKKTTLSIFTLNLMLSMPFTYANPHSRDIGAMTVEKIISHTSRQDSRVIKKAEKIMEADFEKLDDSSNKNPTQTYESSSMSHLR
jgi:hypothetical protein